MENFIYHLKNTNYTAINVSFTHQFNMENKEEGKEVGEKAMKIFVYTVVSC